MVLRPNTPEQSSAYRTTGFIFSAVGAFGFAFKAILIKAAYRYGVDSETLLCLRMGYTLPLLLVMAWSLRRREPRKFTRTDWLELSTLGVLGYYLASYLDFLGLHYISAALERIVIYIYPTLVLLMSAVFLGKPLTKRILLLLGLSYAGVALAVAPDVHAGRGNTLLGVALVLGSSLWLRALSAAQRPDRAAPGIGARDGLCDRASRACCVSRNSSRCDHSGRWRSRGRCTRCRCRWRCSPRCCRSGWSRKPCGASVRQQRLCSVRWARCSQFFWHGWCSTNRSMHCSSPGPA